MPADSASQYPPGALPIGTRLGEFEIRRVLGIGGFGIVYHAFDHLLERDVAVKEYMPASLAGRTETMHVNLLSESNADTFALGLRSFVNEARLLARFDHPSLVKVHRFWEGNGTAYMAMALYHGRNSRDVRAQLQQRPDEAWLRALLEPLLGAIEKLHSEDVYHRDIAPDNIIIEADGRPVLLDFGAARRVISDRSQTLTAILKPSYAPIEQYADTPGLKQGPWTDIYALGATMHFLLTGRPPPPAPARTIQDMLPPLAGQMIENCSHNFLAIVDWMLAPRPDDRPQSVAMLRDALAGRIVPPGRPGAAVQTQPASPFDDDATVPPKTQRPTAAVPPEEQTMRIPRPAPPPGPSDADATVMIPRTGLPPQPPRTGFAGGSTGVHNGIDDPTIRIVRPPPPAPAADDPDATVVTPRPTMAMPAQRQTEFPRPMPPVSPGATPLPPPPPQAPARTINTVRPPPVTPPPSEFKGSGSAWMIPAALGAVLTIGLAVWLWPRSTPDVKSASVVAPAPTPAPAPPPVVAPPSVEATPTATVPPEPPSAAAPAPVPPQAQVTTPPPAALPVPAPAPAPAARPAPPKPAPIVKPPPRNPDPPVAQRPPETTVRPPPPAADPGYRTAPATVPVVVPPSPVAPAPPPQPEAAAVQSPSERCRKQLPLVRLVCIDIECGKAELATHPECLKLRAEQQRNRERLN